MAYKLKSCYTVGKETISYFEFLEMSFSDRKKYQRIDEPCLVYNRLRDEEQVAFEELELVGINEPEEIL